MFKKEASEDGAGACKIVSGRFNTFLRLFLIGPQYCTTSRHNGKSTLNVHYHPSLLGRVDELRNSGSEHFMSSSNIQTCE